MILPDAPWRRREGLPTLLAALGGDVAQVRAVGGAVRDTLLGQPVADLDLATVHRPDAVMDRARAAGLKAVPTGIAHGTVTVVLPSGPVEVTTLRRDVETDGRHARVAFTDDWQADAARRDFTINALSADPAGGEVHDYFGGLDDLAARRVRFIGDPLERIAEDHLRILRFFRFHARFGAGEPDPAGLAACAARARDLMALSRERIAQELLKLLAADDPVPTLRVMHGHAILTPVLPELDNIDGLAALIAREGHHRNVLRRLSALLPADPKIAEAVANRLKLSNAQRRRLSLAADPTAPVDARALAYEIGVEAARDRLLLRGDPAGLDTALYAIDGWEPPRLPISGGTLIAMGLPAGPLVAATLQTIKQRWIAEGFPDGHRASVLAHEAVDQALRARK